METIKALFQKAKDLISEKLKCVKRKVKAFFKKHHVLLTVPAALLVFAISVPVLRWYDPSSGIFDAGIFQLLIVPPLMLFVFLAVAWLAYKTIFGTHHKYLTTEMKDEFKNNITPWQRQKLTYSIYCFIVVLLVAMAMIVS